MPAPPLVTPQAAGEQRLFKHSTKPVKQRLFTTPTPPRIPEKVVIIAMAESHRGSRKFSAAGLCQPCRTPGSIFPIISATRCSRGSGDCCGDRLIPSLPRKDSQTHPKDSQTHPWPPQTSLSYPARKLLQSGTVKADREALAAWITKVCLAPLSNFPNFCLDFGSQRTSSILKYFSRCTLLLIKHRQ